MQARMLGAQLSGRLDLTLHVRRAHIGKLSTLCSRLAAAAKKKKDEDDDNA